MEHASEAFWNRAEQLSPVAFVLAGVLVLGSPAHLLLELVTDVVVPRWVLVFVVFPGFFAAVVGLVGLYPRIADRAPWLARAGLAVGLLAGAGFATVFAWFLAVPLLATIGDAALPATPPQGFLSSLEIVIALGFGLTGAGYLQSGASPRSVGYCLLVFAAPWLVFFAAVPVYGTDLPGWLLLSAYGVMPPALLATGYSLWTRRRPSDAENQLRDLVARSH